jgi:hypothetical protein
MEQTSVELLIASIVHDERTKWMVDDYEWKAILKQAMLEENQGRIDAFDDGYQQGVESMVCTIQDKEFDGVDDGMVTGTITPAIDKAQVFIGLRKLVDAPPAIVIETSTSFGTNNGVIQFAAPQSGVNYNFQSKGTITSAFGVDAVAPITSVVTGIGDISTDTLILRVNSLQVGTLSTDQGTGNYLAYPLYIGRRGGTTWPFNGRIYSLIIRFGANLTAGQITSTESWVNGKTGAY